MEKERVQGYVASLEQIARNTHLDLRETMNVFQELCQRVTPDRIVAPTIITDVRKTYQEIQDQLTKLRGVNQLLESKYRSYYRRDCARDREITEFVFLVKNLYLKFESTLRELEAKKKLTDKEQSLEVSSRRVPFLWFHSRENQVILVKNLRGLYELEYKTGSVLRVEDRRGVIQNRLRSLSLFVLTGEVGLIDILQSRMRLREYDIKERYARDELRGALTHLREISPSEVEGVIRRFTNSNEFLKLKCLLFSIQSQKDLEKTILSSPDNVLRVMMEGEVKTLSL